MATCSCGAAKAVHPTSGYSKEGTCLVALEAQRIMVTCDWPGCGKRVRKFNLGRNYCRACRRIEFAAFMDICRLEGPRGLCLHHPTIAELHEMATTGQIPASRRIPITPANTHVSCGHCHGPLIVFNDPDWNPDLPNSMSVREDGTAWGIPICPKCSFRKAA